MITGTARMRRRDFLRVCAYGGASALPLTGCAGIQRQHLGGYPDVQRLLDHFAATKELRSRGAWNPSQVFQHCAQSIEYSLQGFPALKPALFRSTVGGIAAAVFSGLGQMRHDLAEPIPGAAPLSTDIDAAVALQRLRTAFETFHAYRGPLHPHFAYGVLERDDYLFAHVLHLDNHLDELDPLPGFLRGAVSA